MNLTKMESYLRVNLLGPGPRLMEKRIYRAAVSQRLRNNGLHYCSRVYLLTLNSKVHWLARQSILRTNITNFPNLPE